MIPPQELTKRTSFSKGLKGYEPTEVDEYINFLIEKYTELFAQCDEYQGKLRLVANRISEMQSEEEAIHKLMISTQKYCDTLKEDSRQKAAEILDKAQERAQEIIDEAENEGKKVLINAKQTAERTLLAIAEKAEEQIEDSQEKSEALLMSARTRCAKILSEFRKEIAVQRNGLIALKTMSDNFNDTIFGMYKEHLNSLTENMPELNLDLDELTESKLLNSIMMEIKKDAIDIAEKNGNKEYDFQEELSALRTNIDSILAENAGGEFSEDYGSDNAKSGIRDSNTEYELAASPGSYNDVGSSNNLRNKGENEQDSENIDKTTIFSKVSDRTDRRASAEGDVKIFAGAIAAGATAASGADTLIFDKNKLNSASSESVEQYKGQSLYGEDADDEESIATYDSDDFDEFDQFDRNRDEYGGAVQAASNEEDEIGDYDAGYDSAQPPDIQGGSLYGDSEGYSDYGDDNISDVGGHDSTDRNSAAPRKKGFLGNLFSKKKNKKKNSPREDEIEYDIDDNDDDDDDYDIDLDDL